MRYFYLSLILLSSFFEPFYSVAKVSDNYYFRRYTNKNGLSHNTVYCSLQDKKGFMWFGTDDGLNHFDGYTFKIYRYNPRSATNTGLPNDRIISLYEDSTGKIWICTAGGTCYYDYQTDSFYPLQLTSDKIDFFDQVMEDSHNNLWFRANQRIIRYNPFSSEMQVYHADKYNFRSITMTLTEEGSPIFADASTLYTYRSTTDDFMQTPILTNEEKNERIIIQAIQPIPQVGILIGTDKGGLKLYHQKNGKTETIIPEIQVRAIMPYNTTIYWIASESGIHIYNLIDKSTLNLRKSLTNDFSISDNAIYSLTKDREGGVWIGSFFGGINYLPRNHTNFNYYIGGKTHSGLLGNAIREICPDKYGTLWLGTEDNGINRYNPETGQITNYSVPNALSATNIHGLYAEGDTLWIGTFNKGIDLLHIPSGRILKRYTTANGLTTDFVLCFLKTRNHGFLVGTAEGVEVYDVKNETFNRWKEITGLVRQIHEDKKGNIWFCTTEGIFRYEPSDQNHTEKLHQYRATETYKSQGLGSNNTTSIFEDSKGRIWVTTAYGFSQFQEAANTFNRITTTDGLPSNFTYRIVEDDEKKFWISTANGLVKFDPETHVMHTYTHTDGLHETQFNYCSSYQAADGTIYMGTINGMISFNPKQFKEDTFAPPLYITRIQIPDNLKNKSLIKMSSTDEPVLLKLPYHASTFTLSYIAPAYTSPDAIHYAYMLEGADREWVQMGTNKEVTFAGLSPGKYTFRVKSTNSTGSWQPNEKTLQINIQPPFWATGWAYFIYALITTGVIVYFYKYKKRNLEKKHKRNQELFETEKEKELYNAKIQFFTFITHEIRTPLTLINAPLEKIIRSKDGTESTRHNLQIIQKNTTRLLDLSNQLLDFRKAESKGFRLNFVKTNTTLLIENILFPFYPVLQKEGKNIHIHIPEHPVFAYIDQEAFAKIVSNLLTNAIKYSDNQVFIELIEPSDTEYLFTLVIKNDGRLIPESEKERIFNPFYRLQETETIQGSGIGLSLSRSLAEFHSGTLTYDPSPDGLNLFTLKLPVEQVGYSFSMLDENEVKEPVKVADNRPTGRPVILIVEDQEDMRQFIIDELNEAYDMLEAGQGKTALHILKSTRVDLIISDIMMPVMNGFDLCNQVKNDVQFCHIPFILLTAQHNLESRLTGLNKGADAYMEKPFSLELLKAQIENLFKNRKLLSKAYIEKPLTPSSSLATSTLDDLFLQRLNKFLDENLADETLNVEMIADEMGMSTSSLYRKVKGLSDLSPVDFIRITRLKKAVQLMQQGKLRINEIAFRVGFSSPAYFSTCFQKQYGKSPTEFMKK